MKTTVKDFYCVTPSHGTICPNKSFEINIILYVKSSIREQFDKIEVNHKFLFEFVVIDKEDVNKKEKDIFEQYSQEKKKAKGLNLKKKVKIKEEDHESLGKFEKNQIFNNDNILDQIHEKEESEVIVKELSHVQDTTGDLVIQTNSPIKKHFTFSEFIVGEGSEIKNTKVNYIENGGSVRSMGNGGNGTNGDNVSNRANEAIEEEGSLDLE